MSETFVYDPSEGTPPFLIGGDFVPEPLEGVVVREVDDELVLVDESTGQVHALDRIGSIIWSCYDGSSDLDAIVDELAEAFEVDRDEVYESVVALTKSLARK